MAALESGLVSGFPYEFSFRLAWELHVAFFVGRFHLKVSRTRWGLIC